MPNLGQNWPFFVPCDLEIWQMTLRNNRAPPQCHFKLLTWFHSHRSIQTGVTVRKRQIRVKIGHFFVPCDLEIWRMTWKNNKAPLLYYFKLCASIQTGVTIRTRQIWVKIGHFLSRVTLKFDRWPWKPIGHLSYATSSSVHHFIAMGRFKLELESRNPQFGSKSAIFAPWNLTDDLEKQ